MSTFEVYVESILVQGEQLERMASRYSHYMAEVKNSLRWLELEKMEESGKVEYSLKQELLALRNQKRSLQKLSETLLNIADFYDTAENQILDSGDLRSGTSMRIETVRLEELGRRLKSFGFTLS